MVYLWSFQNSILIQKTNVGLQNYFRRFLWVDSTKLHKCHIPDRISNGTASPVFLAHMLLLYRLLIKIEKERVDWRKRKHIVCLLVFHFHFLGKSINTTLEYIYRFWLHWYQSVCIRIKTHTHTLVLIHGFNCMGCQSISLHCLRLRERDKIPPCVYPHLFIPTYQSVLIIDFLKDGAWGITLPCYKRL